MLGTAIENPVGFPGPPGELIRSASRLRRSAQRPNGPTFEPSDSVPRLAGGVRAHVPYTFSLGTFSVGPPRLVPAASLPETSRGFFVLMKIGMNAEGSA